MILPVIRSWEHLVCLLRGYHIHPSSETPWGYLCATCRAHIDGDPRV